jgi:hypothetical protein
MPTNDIIGGCPLPPVGPLMPASTAVGTAWLGRVDSDGSVELTG